MDTNLIMETENILKGIYYDVKNPAGYSSFEKLYKAAKEQDNNLKRKDVKSWWIGEFTPTLHKPVRWKFKRNPIIVEYIDQQWEADLVDMQEFEKDNKNFRYILTVIDCMSKYAWAIPLGDKRAESICAAFKKIFYTRRFPTHIRTDQGKEFLNKKFKPFLKKFGVYHFTSKNKDIKCAIVERFNRTLKTRMHKFFTAKGTRNWIDNLDDFVAAYNDSFHRTIKRTPNQAIESKNDELFRTIYGVANVDDLKSNKVPELKTSDSVRLAYEKKNFDKSYYPNWTDTVEKVEKIIVQPNKPMYGLENKNQTFYPEQVQKVIGNVFRVEKILRTRTRNGKKQLFIKWINYPENYNSWVDENDLYDLRNE